MIAFVGCSTQLGVVDRSPIQPKQEAPSATQPTQQTAAVAVSANDAGRQDITNHARANDQTQQKGTIVYNKGDTTIYNDPKMMYSMMALLAGFSWYHRYEAGRRRRIKREKKVIT